MYLRLHAPAYSKCLATPTIRAKYEKKVRVRLRETSSGQLAAEAEAEEAASFFAAGRAAAEAAVAPPKAPDAPAAPSQGQGEKDGDALDALMRG